MRSSILTSMSYKQRNLLLLGASGLLLIFVITVSCRPTLQARQKHRLMQQQISRAATASQQMQQLETQMAELKAFSIAPYKRELLLESVTSFCREKGLMVTAFPQAERLKQGEATVVTHQIEVQGSYEAMVQLVYLLEQEDRLGAVSSLRFFKYKDRKARKQRLRANITLRNLEG